MTALAKISPLRRGICPGLSAPMPTGDGLLVRLMPIGTIPLDTFAKLCAAAREHGNGIVEITARGSIQVRGLNDASAPQFAAAIAALGIAAEDGMPVLSNPLAGLDPDEIIDAGKLAADMRRALVQGSLAGRLAPKISVVIDGGGALNLDEVSADVRLRAEMRDHVVFLRIGIGGDGASAMQVGVVPLGDGIEAAIRLLEVIARRGRDARGRDVLAAEGIAPFRAALAIDPDSCEIAAAAREKSEPIGLHRLRDRLLACGIGLAFGHADASSLEHLVSAARTAGACGIRVAPERALIAIGLTDESSPAFAAAAERLGFIVRANDPRRHVVACAGAPVCASAHIAARAMAPHIAETAAPFLGRSFTIHVSGCAKSCAHPAPAALTVLGTPEGCALIAGGAVHDAPFATVTANELPAAIAGAIRDREERHV